MLIFHQLNPLLTLLGQLLAIQETTKTIMDQFVLGKRRGLVLCDILDADKSGNPPDTETFDESSPSLLDVIVETNNKVCFMHVLVHFIYYLKNSHLYHDPPQYLIGDFASISVYI